MRRTAVLCVVVSLVTVVAGVTAPAEATPRGAALTAWHNVPAPIPSARVRPGRYEAVSCPTRSFCMAITTGVGSRGYHVGIAEIERHGKWTVSEIPGIGSKRSHLNAVSCASATSCVVVGSSDAGESPTILRWDGSRWHALTGPATAGDGAVTAVSCASAGYCVALGGRDWAIRRNQLTPVAHSDADDAISCVTATFCLAVGGGIGTPERRPGLVERWNGSTWSDVPAADIHLGKHHDVALTGVSCATVAQCSVVGNITYYRSSTRQEHRLVTETDDAGAWHRRIFPKAAGFNVHRMSFGISCTAPDHCVAAVLARVGGRRAADTLVRGPGGWKLAPLRYPRGKLVTAPLIAISCSSGGCTLVGGQRTAGVAGRVVRERGGTARNESPATVRQAEESSLNTVSCAGSFCLAVGYASPPGSKLSPLAAATTGGRWHRVAAPKPPGDLLGVSCVTAQFCMAIGVGARRSVGTAAIWNGTSWRAVTVPDRPVRGVSCPTTRFCAGSPVQRGAQLQWQLWRPRTGWRTETLPSPPNLRRPGPISCVSASDCWTTTTWYGADERYHVTAAHWDGSAWTTQRLRTHFIGDLSCESGDFCIAVGSRASEVWDGTSWTAVPYENGDDLNSPRVSCVNADDCTVLGGDGATGDPVDAMSQHWDGNQWGQQQVYPPDGAADALNANSLACNTSGCLTVGVSEPGIIVPSVLQNY